MNEVQAFASSAMMRWLQYFLYRSIAVFAKFSELTLPSFLQHAFLPARDVGGLAVC
jgi:hypothetical protein